MPQDAFHIKRLALELNAALAGGKVNRVSQADKDELTLIIYTEKGTVKLILNTNASFARVCIQKTEKPPLLVAPSFCMLLRKHLCGAQLLSVKQVENERILALTFLCFNDFSGGEKVVYAELMGKYSNLILTEKGVILGALKSTSLENASGRILFSGAKYALPPAQDKISPSDLSSLCDRWQDFLIFLAAENNSGCFSKNDGGRGEKNAFEYALSMVDINAESAAKFIFNGVAGIALPTARRIVFLSRERGVSVHDFPAFFVDFFNNERVCPCLTVEDGAFTDFFAFTTAEDVNRSVKTQTLTEAEEKYYVTRSENRAFNEKRTRFLAVISSKIKKCEKNIAETKRRLTEAENAESNRVKGELITANIYKAQKGDDVLLAENWYEGGKQEKIALDKALSPAANAQKYFRIYAKEKRTKQVLAPRYESELSELSYFQSVAAFLRLAETADDLAEVEEELRAINLLPQEKARKKKQTECAVPFKKYEIGGFSLLVGRNNASNDHLVRALNSEDIWLHTQKYHSAHVGIVTDGKRVPDEVLLAAAELCVHFSEVKNGEKAAVDYTRRKYVKKPKKAALGFVTYSDYKTLYVAAASHDAQRIL